MNHFICSGWAYGTIGYLPECNMRDHIRPEKSDSVQRLLPDGTFILLGGERDDIPEGPPQYDSDGNEIDTDEESD